MIYLIGKMLFWLVLIGLLGAAAGWFARGYKEQRKQATASPSDSGDEQQQLVISSLQQEREALMQQIKTLNQNGEMLKIRIAEIEYANHGE